MSSTVLYSDINQFTPTQKPILVDLESIYQSITNILSTSKESRLFLPEFGSNFDKLLMEPMIDVTEALLFDEVANAVTAWEPRVKVNFAESSVESDYDNNRYTVTVVFTVIGLETQKFQYVGIYSRGNL